MATSNKVVFSGSTNTISVPFAYLDKSHVKVYLDDVLQDPSTYSWPSDGQIALTAGNPASGTVGEARRRTPTEPITTFTPGNLDVTDLNVAALQPLFVAEEGRDVADVFEESGWQTTAGGPGGTITKGAEGTVPIYDAEGNLTGSALVDPAYYATLEEAVLAARDQAEAWAEGTLPGGVGTKSAKEWALQAEAAITFTPIVTRGTIDAGLGPYDAGGEIGSENNIDIKVGGVEYNHNLYTVSGTTFTFKDTVDGGDPPEAGLPWESKINAEVRQLAVPGDRTVGLDQLSTEVLDLLNEPYVVTAEVYGAVLDGTPEDQALVKTAAMAAVAAGRPFVVPHEGFTWDEGLVLQVPEDFPTARDALEATQNWIFPAYKPKYSDTQQNHIKPVAVTISCSADMEHLYNGTNITVNHPHGDLIRIKGRRKTGLTFASQQAHTFSSGIQFLRFRFSTWPAVDPKVGETLRIILPTGSGAYQSVEGAWRITAVDAVNKDLTIAVYMRNAVGVETMIVGGGIFLHIPTTFRFINQEHSGADVGGFDVHTAIRLSDIAISGNSAGTNASSTNGIVVRENAKVDLEQHVAVLEFQRSGLWLLNDAYAQVGYAAFCGNNSGINNLQSVVDGTNVAMCGNETYNYIGGIGSSGSIVTSAFDGAGTAGVLVNGNASLICSGHARENQYGVLCWPGGFVNINDMNVRANTVTDIRRHKGGRVMLTANDAGTFNPALDTADTFGGWTALDTTLAA